MDAPEERWCLGMLVAERTGDGDVERVERVMAKEREPGNSGKFFIIKRVLHFYTFTLLHFYTFTRLHVYTFTCLHVYTFTLFYTFTI